MQGADIPWGHSHCPVSSPVTQWVLVHNISHLCGTRSTTQCNYNNSGQHHTTFSNLQQHLTCFLVLTASYKQQHQLQPTMVNYTTFSNLLQQHLVLVQAIYSWCVKCRMQASGATITGTSHTTVNTTVYRDVTIRKKRCRVPSYTHTLLESTSQSEVLCLHYQYWKQW